MTDFGSIDYEKPGLPCISRNFRRYLVNAVDYGTTYYYYVESFEKDDTSENSVIARSQTKEYTITTNVNHYLYIVDYSSDTIVTQADGLKTEKNYIQPNRRAGYLHVAAVDGAGNIGPTKTILIDNGTLTQKRRKHFLIFVVSLCVCKSR